MCLRQVLWETVLFSESENGWFKAHWLGELDAVLCVSSGGDMVLVDCEDAAHGIEPVGKIDDVRPHCGEPRSAVHCSSLRVLCRVLLPWHALLTKKQSC